MFEMIPLFAGLPGGMELAVILLIAVLLFGANKIPKLARSTGQAMGEFQKGRQQLENEIDEMKKPPSDTSSENDSSTSDSASTAETDSIDGSESDSSSDSSS